jgi:Tfp pilus assembly protein PilO
VIWREKKWLLISLGGFLLANALFFVTYRVRYEERVRELDARLDQAQDRLQRARNERAAAEAELRTYQQTVNHIENIYSNIWATSDARLAPLLIEMRQLASASGLRPRSISYRMDTEEKDVGATFFEISFGVSGTYAQIRRMINLLELSRQFVIIDELSLSGDATGLNVLQMNIRLKTLFRGQVPPRRRGETS